MGDNDNEEAEKVPLLSSQQLRPPPQPQLLSPPSQPLLPPAPLPSTLSAQQASPTPTSSPLPQSSSRPASDRLQARLREPFTHNELEEFLSKLQKMCQGASKEDAFRDLCLPDYITINARSSDTGISFADIQQYSNTIVYSMVHGCAHNPIPVMSSIKQT
jgi:hypothetical protein